MEGTTTRRGLLVTITAGLSALLGAVLAVPFVAALVSPARKAAASAPPSEAFVPVIPIWDLPTGVPKRVEIVADDVDGWARQERRVMGAVWLIKVSKTEVKAFSTVCPHLGCSINAAASGFACPCHTSAFAADGQVTGGPAPRSMDPLEAKVEKDTVLVRYARFRQGQAKREEI
ncbi:MAG TPA: ubiquinol-cytochrome c reductase iron-sulfur subunit [Myxococcales bacterium]|nr:ubiquinol-cytochrome c reductase iron-sulfur subunit [Myxococcales bacterium]